MSWKMLTVYNDIFECWQYKMIYWNVDMMMHLNVDNNDVLKCWQNKMMYLNADDIKWCIQKYDAYAQIFGRFARFRNKNDVFKT